MPSSTNASASIFGWQFQVNAGIVLMLRFLQEATRLKIEGLTEDIEITCEDGSIIYAQAKSFDNPNVGNVASKLKKGLSTLHAAAVANSHYRRLIYITNSLAPIVRTRAACHYVNQYISIRYDDLYDVEKNVVNKYIVENKYDLWQINSLYFCGLPYDGLDPEQRHREIIFEIRRFLRGTNMEYHSDTALSHWQNICNFNATVRSINISKAAFVWPLIVIATDIAHGDPLFVTDGELDVASLQQVKEKFHSLIDIMSEKFSVTTRIITEFVTEYGPRFSPDNQVRFITERWRNYRTEFPLDGMSDEEQEYLTKLILQRVLASRHITKTIKERAKL